MTSDFRILGQSPGGRARAGLLETAHGVLETPAFLPVATQGTVKALTQEDLESLGVRGVLSNAYHLLLRPGPEVVERLGGLHAFTGYRGAILTDSGGFQVWSLAPLREVTEEGVTFKSHLDGLRREFTPEGVIDLQARLGSDIWTSLDELVPWPCHQERAREAMERSWRWAERSARVLPAAQDGAGTPGRNSAGSRGASQPGQTPAGGRRLFFPVIQGSLYPSLRVEAARRLKDLPHDGVSLGGFSVGESKDLTWSVLEQTVDALPPETPRYLMGVGTPEDLWEAAARGVDLMDCVWPTRAGRHGVALTRSGRLNVMNAACREDPAPLEPGCACRVCARHSRAFIAHLYRARELTAYALLTYHNLHVLLGVARDIRAAILEGRFEESLADAAAREPA